MAGSVGTLREWLGEGPFCLALSSSWLGLFCHAGVVCALVESGFAPAKISGSSGTWCSDRCLFTAYLLYYHEYYNTKKMHAT